MPQSPLIPKEQAAGIQRWEFGTFDGPRDRRKGESVASAAAAATAAAASATRVRELTERAKAEGYAAGHREGLEAARQQAAAETGARIARADQLLHELAEDLQRFDRELAHEVVQLGLAVAKKMIGAALKANPEVVRVAVEEALRHVAHVRGPVTLAVNPDDAAVVRAYLETSPPQSGWSVREDPLVAAGGCRVETAAGEVDATLESRWHRVTAALGTATNWVEE
ncbi:MAG TPA: FliH/SctL family protein [Burkholderiales bacterium]|nr:FliH/SctL family protein [Burkholderiales bacterium]